MKKGRAIAIILALLVLSGVCIVYVMRGISAVRDSGLKESLSGKYYSQQPASETAEDLPEDTAEAENAEEAAEEVPEEDKDWISVSKDGTVKIHKDFSELYEQNSDIVGWLKAGESIDYPIVQRDNDFYLHNNFKQKSDSNGTLFLNECNSLDPRDDVLLIHGHNMASGAMFGRLKDFESYEYAAENPVVTFRTVYDEEDVYYTPVAVFNASMIRGENGYFDITQIIFEDDDPLDGSKEGRQSSAYRAYLDELASKRLWEPKTDVNENDKLMMLITCSYYHTDGRLIVVCRELRDGETPESIKALYAAG